MMFSMFNKFLTVAAFAASAWSSTAQGQTMSADSCLLIDNARLENRTITVEIDGYSGYWIVAPNQTYAITAAPVGANTSDSTQRLLRGSSFSFRVYDGDERQGSKGPLYDTVTAAWTVGSYGTSSHTLLTPVQPPQSNDPKFEPECRSSGFWLALVHS
jgi:hypothetical protein